MSKVFTSSFEMPGDLFLWMSSRFVNYQLLYQCYSLYIYPALPIHSTHKYTKVVRGDAPFPRVPLDSKLVILPASSLLHIENYPFHTNAIVIFIQS